MIAKRFHIEIYKTNGHQELIGEFDFDTKKEQIGKYKELLEMGYSKKALVKLTREWYA